MAPASLLARITLILQTHTHTHYIRASNTHTTYVLLIGHSTCSGQCNSFLYVDRHCLSHAADRSIPAAIGTQLESCLIPHTHTHTLHEVF